MVAILSGAQLAELGRSPAIAKTTSHLCLFGLEDSQSKRTQMDQSIQCIPRSGIESGLKMQEAIRILDVVTNLKNSGETE
jgi:hypothetical protein